MISWYLLTTDTYSTNLYCIFYPKHLQRITEGHRYKTGQKGREKKSYNKFNQLFWTKF